MYLFIVIAGLSVCMCGIMCVMARIWMSETTYRTILSVLHVRPGFEPGLLAWVACTFNC